MQMRGTSASIATPSSRLNIKGLSTAPLQVCANRSSRALQQGLTKRRTACIIRAAQQTDQQTTKEVEHKLREAFEQAKEAEHDITAKRASQEQEAEQRQKDQRFDRAKDALNLKEQGHNLDPTAGHEQGELDADESVEEKTRKNASPSKAVRQRLQELEATRSPQPQQVSRIVNRRDPVPPMSHHYAAAAWWAVTALAPKGSKGQANLGYQ